MVALTSSIRSQVEFKLGEEYKALDYYLEKIKNGEVSSCKFKGKRKVNIKGHIFKEEDSVTFYKRKIKLFKTGQKREKITIKYSEGILLAIIILYDNKVHSAEILVTDPNRNRIFRKIAPEYFTQKNDFIKKLK
jgi:hypothetical protein